MKMKNFGGMSALAMAAGLGVAMSPAERRMGRLMRDGTGHQGGGGTKTAAELVLEVKEQLSQTTDKVKEIAEQAVSEAKAGTAIANGVKEQADELLIKMNGLAEKFADLEQRSADDSKKGEDFKSIGARFAESDSLKSLVEGGGRGKADIEVKASITSATTNAAGSAGAAIDTTRLQGIIGLPMRRMFVQDLIAPGQMSGNTLEYVRQKVRTNNAGMVAEGAAKPQSDFQLELVSTGAKVIAHYMKASRQIMDDAAQMRTFIDNNLLYGLAFKKEDQIINGDGTGQNLSGLIANATAYAAPVGAAAAGNLMDILRIAMLQAVLAEYPATGHILNPIDWSNIERLKDTEGRYLIGNPQGTAAPTLWGLPVVATQFMAQDKFLTGAFDLAAQYFDRWQARVQLATENEDDFIKNMVTILAEERGALAIYRPSAIIYGDLGQVA